MALRIDLGGAKPSEGEKSYGELRHSHYVEIPDALASFCRDQVWNDDSIEADSPREALTVVLADVIAGEYDEEMEAENEVDPDDYDRDEWVENNPPEESE